MNFIQLILPTIEHFHVLGYWLAFLAALVETTIGLGLVIPGSTIILLMGALAAKGYFDLGDLIWFAIIGAIIGDNINYFIGKKYGLKILQNGFWFIKPLHLKKGEDFFKKNGGRSVLFGRFIPNIKEIMPLIAGAFGMKRLPFMISNILGAIGWSLIWILPGYFFAHSLDVAKVWLTRTGYFLTIVLIVFFIFYLLKIFIVKKGREFFLFLFSLWQSIKEAIIKNREVKEFTQRHSKFLSFLHKRFVKSDFYGWPLTLLVLAMVYVLALFTGVVEGIINSDVIVAADIRVNNLLIIFHRPELLKIFYWITLLGKWEIILIFVLTTIIILWLWGKRFYIIPLLLSIIGSEIFTAISKVVFHRTRPELAVYTENSFSFPSGHAASAVAFYGFIAYCLIRNNRSWSRKVNIFFGSFIIIALIGFSRLYLGVHFVSDVWGGYLAGAIWLIIGISLIEYKLAKQSAEAPVSSSVWRRLATTGAVIIAILFYVIFANYHTLTFYNQSTSINKIVVNDIVNIFNSDNLKYTETLLGNKQEPLSMIIIARDDQQLISLFEQANWVLADDISLASSYKMVRSILFHQSYRSAPMTPDFWNSEVNNFGFEKETAANSVRTRHHARFWKTNYVTINNENIYVGTASFDSGIKWGITHKINPDIDNEREFLFNDLQATSKIIATEKIQLVDPRLGSNFTGDLFFTDGKLYILTVGQTN